MSDCNVRNAASKEAYERSHKEWARQAKEQLESRQACGMRAVDVPATCGSCNACIYSEPKRCSMCALRPRRVQCMSSYKLHIADLQQVARDLYESNKYAFDVLMRAAEEGTPGEGAATFDAFYEAAGALAYVGRDANGPGVEERLKALGVEV